MSDDEEEGGMYRAETVPPPDGEADAYNAPTKVGPMAAQVVAEMMRGAEQRVRELNARVSKREDPRAEPDDAPPSRQAVPPPSKEPNEPKPARSAADTKPPPAEAKSKPADAPAPAKPKGDAPAPVKPKAVEPKAVEPKAVEPKAVEAKAVEAKAVEAKAVEAKAVEAKAPLKPVAKDAVPDAPPSSSAARAAAKSSDAAKPVEKPVEEAAAPALSRIVHEEDEEHAATLVNRDARRNPIAAVATTSPVLEEMARTPSDPGLTAPALSALAPKPDRTHVWLIAAVVVVAAAVIYFLRH